MMLIQEDYFRNIFNTVRGAILILDGNLRVLSANRSFFTIFRVDAANTIGSLLYDLGNGQWNIPHLRVLLEDVLPKNDTVDDYEIVHDFESIGRKSMLLNACKIREKKDEQPIILLAIEDITERKRLEELLTESEMRYRRIFETASDGILLLEKNEGKIAHANPSAEIMMGYSEEECLGKSLQDIGIPIDMSDFSSIMQTLGKSGIINYEDISVKTSSGEDIYTDVYLVDRATLAQCNIRDVTERKQIEVQRETLLQWKAGINLLERSLLAPTTLEQKLKSITDDIVRLFEIDFCRIWLIRPGDLCEDGCIHAREREGSHVCNYRDRCLHLRSSSGRYTHTDGKVHRRVPFGCYKIGRIASEEEHKFLTNDVQNDPLVHDHQWARNLGLVSFAGYQIRVPGSNVLGVLAVFAKHIITAEEDALLDGISNATAMVILQAEVEMALKQSEEKFRILFEKAADSILLLEIQPDGVPIIRDANRSTFQCLGYERAELIGQPITFIEVAPGASKEVAKRRHDIRAGTGNIFELEHRCKDGTIRDFECSVSELHVGTKTFAISIERDITTRKLFEETLKTSEERFRTVIESLTDVVFEWDTREKIEWFGDIDGLTGYPRGGFPRTKEAWTATLHPEDKGRVIAALEGQLTGVSPYEVEYRVMRRDGEWRWWSARGIALNDDTGNPIKMVGSITDITDHKQAENELRESKALFETVVESIPFMLFLKEATDLRFVIFNRAGEELLGYDRKELLGKNNLDLFPPEQAAYFMAKDREALDGKAAVLDIPEELILTAKKGQRLLHTRKIRIPGSDGTTKYLLGISEDITERKQAEEEMIKKNKEIEQYLYTASHDLRTPLVTVKTFMGYLEQDMVGSDRERVVQDIRFINGAADKMKLLLDDLLEFARIDRIEGPPVGVSLLELLHGVLGDLAGVISEHNVDIVLPETDLMLFGDRPRLYQIWENLIENAIKYSHDDTAPRIELGVLNKNEKSVFFVKDYGIGIAPEYHSKVFGIFEKLDPKTAGSGLGLSMVKRVVEKYGGRVWVESKGNDKGSCFCFTLPRAMMQS